MILIWLHIVLFSVYLAVDFSAWQRLLYAILASTFAYINAVSINDISDRETDMINLPKQNQADDRPIINDTISSRQAWVIAVLSMLLCLIACFFLQPWLVIAGGVMIILNAVYSLPPLRVSKRGAVAQYLLPIMYVGFPACIAVALGSAVSGMFLLLVLGQYAVFIGRLFLKDIRDETGDKATGKRTYLVRHGLRPTLLQSGAWMVLGIGIMGRSLLDNIDGGYVIGTIGVIAGIGSVKGLVACYRASKLEHKLLWVAITGRFASMWTFCVLISLLLHQARLPSPQQLVLIVLTAGIFLAGALMLYEELQSVKRHPAK